MTSLPPQSAVRELRVQLEDARSVFGSFLDSLPESSWAKQSSNPAWTNGQVLFHIAFAFMLLPPLVTLARILGRLPAPFSRAFAGLLDLGTGLFNRVNALGPRAAGTVYNRGRLKRKFESVHSALIRILSSLDPIELQRGMYYPHKWDSLFHDYMTIEDVLRYPAVHMRFHLGQVRP